MAEKTSPNTAPNAQNEADNHVFMASVSFGYAARQSRRHNKDIIFALYFRQKTLVKSSKGFERFERFAGFEGFESERVSKILV
jgi:hypothetical protein